MQYYTHTYTNSYTCIIIHTYILVLNYIYTYYKFRMYRCVNSNVYTIVLMHQLHADFQLKKHLFTCKQTRLLFRRAEKSEVFCRHHRELTDPSN